MWVGTGKSSGVGIGKPSLGVTVTWRAGELLEVGAAKPSGIPLAVGEGEPSESGVGTGSLSGVSVVEGKLSGVGAEANPEFKLLVAFISEALPGPNDLSNEARAFDVSVHPLGDTPNKKSLGTPAMSVNQLS